MIFHNSWRLGATPDALLDFDESFDGSGDLGITMHVDGDDDDMSTYIDRDGARRLRDLLDAALGNDTAAPPAPTLDDRVAAYEAVTRRRALDSSFDTDAAFRLLLDGAA